MGDLIVWFTLGWATGKLYPEIAVRIRLRLVEYRERRAERRDESSRAVEASVCSGPVPLASGPAPAPVDAANPRPASTGLHLAGHRRD